MDTCDRLFDEQVTGDLKAARCLLDPQSIKIVASPPIYKAFIGILVGRVPPPPRFDRVAMAYEAPEDVEGLKRTAVFDRQASRGG